MRYSAIGRANAVAGSGGRSGAGVAEAPLTAPWEDSTTVLLSTCGVCGEYVASGVSA